MSVNVVLRLHFYAATATAADAAAGSLQALLYLQLLFGSSLGAHRCCKYDSQTQMRYGYAPLLYLSSTVQKDYFHGHETDGGSDHKRRRCCCKNDSDPRRNLIREVYAAGAVGPQFYIAQRSFGCHNSFWWEAKREQELAGSKEGNARRGRIFC